MTTKIFLLCILLLILPSCVWVQRYPERWSPPLASTPDCPDISGVYENRGEDAGGNKSRLSVALSPTWGMVDDRSITRTEITQAGDETLRATFYAEGGVVSEKTFTRAGGNFTCESGWLVIDHRGHRALSKYLLGMDWEQDRLSKNAAGDLLIRKRQSGVGLFAVIPVAEIDWLWLRFSKADIPDRNAAAK